MPTDPHLTLTRLGLSESEASMYLALLAHGDQPVQILAREARISRTAAYEVLDTLNKRGLVIKKADGTKWTFLAEDPEKLETYFSQRLSLFTAEFETLKRLTPELRVRQGAYSTHPRVRLLSGYEGLADLFEDIERVAPDTLYEFCDYEHLVGVLDVPRINALRKVINYGRTSVKFLYRGALDVERRREGVEYRKIPELLSFRGDFWVYANRVVLINYQKDSLDMIVIDQNVFADMMRALFLTAWNATSLMHLPNAPSL